MQIVFLFYDGMTALDTVGPHEILSRLPAAVVKRVAIKAGPIVSSADLKLTADYALSEVSWADVLVIPGAKSATTLQEFPEILAWVRSIHETTTWTTSVCTGSLILGAAGLLNGLKATSHWATLERLEAWGAYPTRARVVEDGKIVTAAGVSAGLDMALMLAAKVAGPECAKALQLTIEYDPEPPFDSGSPDKADPELCEALRKRIVAGLESIQ